MFQSTYLYGAFSPLDGDNFLLELPNCNSLNFQIFLEHFSKQNPEDLKVVVLDNGAFHKAKGLVVPDNIILIFLPPYSPELNPAEKIWAKFKRTFTNKLFNSLSQLSNFICDLASNLTFNEVISITRFDYIFVCPYWTFI